MRRVQSLQSRRGVTLMETVITLAVLVLLGLVLMPMLESARSQMRGAGSSANLMAIGQGGAMYANDHAGRVFSYTWEAGVEYILPDGRPRIVFDDQAASDYQCAEILQRLTGRISGATRILPVTNRLPHRRYQHLILLDYFGQSLGSPMYIDPADANQLYWAKNPLEYLDDNSTLPYEDDPGPGYDSDHNWDHIGVRQRWTFASSYQPVPAAWQFDAPAVRYGPIDNTPHLFLTTGPIEEMDLHTGRRFNEVRFPGNKVWFHEEFDRDAGHDMYFAYPQARPEKLMFDGSVNNWRTGEALPSGVPEEGPGPWTQSYVPLDTFPIPLRGLGSTFEMNFRYRWTWLGLRGVDYGPMDAPRGPSVKRVGP